MWNVLLTTEKFNFFLQLISNLTFFSKNQTSNLDRKLKLVFPACFRWIQFISLFNLFLKLLLDDSGPFTCRFTPQWVTTVSQSGAATRRCDQWERRAFQVRVIDLWGTRPLALLTDFPLKPKKNSKTQRGATTTRWGRRRYCSSTLPNDSRKTGRSNTTV